MCVPQEMFGSLPSGTQDAIMERFKHGISLSTHYSGMGSSEAAASFISQLARARHGEDQSGFHGLD
eukprot:418866-Alexandrium_andersonii.AAC.1